MTREKRREYTRAAQTALKENGLRVFQKDMILQRSFQLGLSPIVQIQIRGFAPIKDSFIMNIQTNFNVRMMQ